MQAGLHSGISLPALCSASPCRPPTARIASCLAARLDLICSGCVVLATRQEAAGELIGAFRQRQVHKYYCALSDRRPSKKMGSVAGEMQRGRRWVAPGGRMGLWLPVLQACSALARQSLSSAHSPSPPLPPPPNPCRGAWMLARSSAAPAADAPAPPVYKAVTRFTSTAVLGSRPGLRAFLLKPETGRTHQLRVALKSLGSPVLGDEVRHGGELLWLLYWFQPISNACLVAAIRGAAECLCSTLSPVEIKDQTCCFPALPPAPAAVCAERGSGVGGARIPPLRGAAV